MDDDLGRSGVGIGRPGFERLLAATCDGRVGAVLAIEAPRLARNGRDWHTPDKRVQQAIQLVFSKFAELQSAPGCASGSETKGPN